MSDMKIDIIYEDNNILAINKSAGIMVHGDGRSKEKTIVDWILEKYPEIKGVGKPMILPDGTRIEKPGFVHRLDKDTSGIMLIAKNQKTFEFLKKQFQARTIKKVYQAIVWGNVKEDKGKIDKPIGRSPSTGYFLSSRGVRGKMREAVTEYKVIKRITNNQQPTTDNKFTILEVCPHTGRTHQIRVHLKYINHPIICDKIYFDERGAPRTSTLVHGVRAKSNQSNLYASNMPCPVLGLDRLALHAASVEFLLPNNKRMKLEAPLPEEMKRLI